MTIRSRRSAARPISTKGGGLVSGSRSSSPRDDLLRMCAALAVGLAFVPAAAASGTAAARGTEVSGVLAPGFRDLADVSGAGEMPPPTASLTGISLVKQRTVLDVEPARFGPAAAPDIPPVVLAAYQRAALAVDDADPGCGVTWWMLAAIGKVESDHANGGRVDASGTTLEPIRGPWLDGGPGTAAVASSVGGGAVWERAEGPMQFLPAAWVVYGSGGNPDNIDDAALGAARYLCAGTGDLSETGRLAAAVFRYNRSDVYVAAALSWALAYSTGSAPAPGPTGGTADAGRGSRAASAIAAAVAYATAQLGLPYVWGGNGPAHGDVGFDCSGLTHAAYVAAGIPTPRTAQTQYDAGPRLGLGETPAVGDLVFYGSPGRVHHVGLYVGNDRMINAPTFGRPVQLAGYRRPGDDYLGATRPAARPGSLPAYPVLSSTPRRPSWRRAATALCPGPGPLSLVPGPSTHPTLASVLAPGPDPVPTTPTLTTTAAPTPTTTPALPSAADRSRPFPPTKSRVAASPATSESPAPTTWSSVSVTTSPRPSASSPARPAGAVVPDTTSRRMPCSCSRPAVRSPFAARAPHGGEARLRGGRPGPAKRGIESLLVQWTLCQ